MAPNTLLQKFKKIKKPGQLWRNPRASEFTEYIAHLIVAKKHTVIIDIDHPLPNTEYTFKDVNWTVFELYTDIFEEHQ